MLILLFAVTPAVAMSQSITCQTSIYCDGSQTCTNVDNILHVEVTDSKAALSFDDAPAFPGRVAHTTDLIVIVSEDSDIVPFQLVIGPGGQGAYSVMNTYEGIVSPSFYPLQCE
jgi:hypothetical protein